MQTTAYCTGKEEYLYDVVLDVCIVEKRTPAISVLMLLLKSDEASECVEWDQASIYEGGKEVVAGRRCWRTRSGGSCEVVECI